MTYCLMYHGVMAPKDVTAIIAATVLLHCAAQENQNM